MANWKMAKQHHINVNLIIPHEQTKQSMGGEDGRNFIVDHGENEFVSVTSYCSEVIRARGLKFCMVVYQRDAVGAIDQNFEILPMS